MELLKKTSYWCNCADAKLIDGKIEYTRFDGARGYQGAGIRPSHQEILESEKKGGENSVLCAVLETGLTEKIPEEYFIISKIESLANAIHPEFFPQIMGIAERNREKEEKFRQEEAKVIEILNETAERISFIFDFTGKYMYENLVGHENDYPIKLSRRKEFEPESVPDEFYERMITIRVLFPWNSSEAEFIRKNFKQYAFLNVF